MASVDEAQDLEHVEDPRGRAKFLRAIGFFSIFVLALVAASVALDTQWGSGGGSASTQSAPPPAFDPEGFTRGFALVGVDAANDYDAARTLATRDYRYDEAEQGFKDAKLTADEAVSWAKKNRAAYGLPADHDAYVRAVEFAQALATAAQSGDDCMDEYQSEPEDAFGSDACRRHEHDHEVTMRRGEEWEQTYKRYI